MLGEKDLIFLGACILAASVDEEAFSNKYFLQNAINASKFLYKEIFDDSKDSMIFE